ncbi:MAG: flagellar brake protein [Nitrospiraceae bacterium]|nr:flagellar brake protein [Nitrospiraceae bacterium]
MGEPSLPCQSAGSFLAVGLPLQMHLSGADNRSQYGSSLLGWREGAWLMCEWPFQLGQPVPCAAGSQCVIRYMYQGRMVGFRSEVLSTHHVPFPFLLLTYPTNREEVALRKHCRIATNEPLVLTRVSDGLPTPRSETPDRIGGLLRDLSAAGCCISLQRAAHDFFPGMCLRMEFEVLGIGHISNLAGIVRNIAPVGDVTELGVEFRFDGKESIEYRGWGASVQKTLEQWASRAVDASSSVR